MMAAINPAHTNFDETMSTLRYADQAKRIKNKPIVNEDPKDAQIREMRDRIKQLEDQLQNAMKNGGISSANMAAVQKVMQNIKGMQDDVPKDEVEEIEEVEDPEEAEKLKQISQQKQTLAQQLKKQEESQSAAKVAIEEMKEQLKQLKGAVVTGKELEDANRMKEQQIREAKIKLAEKAEKEMLMKRALQ